MRVSVGGIGDALLLLHVFAALLDQPQERRGGNYLSDEYQKYKEMQTEWIRAVNAAWHIDLLSDVLGGINRLSAPFRRTSVCHRGA